MNKSVNKNYSNESATPAFGRGHKVRKKMAIIVHAEKLHTTVRP